MNQEQWPARPGRPRNARAALGFLTTVPVRGAAPDPGSAAWFGPVGALVGLAVGGAWWLGTEVWNPLVGAALGIVVDLALTGIVHLDGLADSADGLLPPLPRQRRQQVMSTPDVGGFGVASVGAILLLRLAALTAMAPRAGLLAAIWAAGRAVAALSLAAVPSARSYGLGAGFARGFARGQLALPLATLAGATVASLVLAPSTLAGAMAVPAVIAGAAGVLALGVRRLGGHTGDVLGAAIVVGETAGLLAAGARW